MDSELDSVCRMLDRVRHDATTRANVRRAKLRSVAFTLRKSEVPDMPDSTVEVLASLAYLTGLSAYHHDLAFFTHASVLQSMSCDYRRFLAFMMSVADQLDAYSECDIATDEDWKSWIESM